MQNIKKILYALEEFKINCIHFKKDGFLVDFYGDLKADEIQIFKNLFLSINHGLVKSNNKKILGSFFDFKIDNYLGCLTITILFKNDSIDIFDNNTVFKNFDILFVEN